MSGKGEASKEIAPAGNDNHPQAVKEAAAKVAEGKDVVVMEGSNNFREGYIVNLSPSQTVKLLDAKVVTVVGYQDDLQMVLRAFSGF